MDTDTAASLRLTPRQLIRLVAVVNGVTIANLYYCQPLLPQIALSYAETPSVGNLTATGQLGYALGLILLVPLGDIVRRRRLVCLLLCVDAVALVATATAPTVEVLLATGVVVGAATSSVVQILLPYAATLAAEHERGRVVATVLSASLSGILLSRAVAGLVGQFFGWPTVFLAAAAVSLVLSGIVVRFMTPTAPEVAIGYRAQLGATLHLAMSEPLLRRRSLIGALVFATFGAFWATVAFLLAAPPFGYTEAEIGLFALVSGVGALAARLTGRLADRGWQRSLTGALLTVGFVSYGAAWMGNHSAVWLIVGLLGAETARGGVHLLNMSVVYNLVEGARSRVASVYMTSYTLGGVMGAAGGTAAYRLGGWGAACAVGAACMAAALAVWSRETRCGSGIRAR